MQEVNEAGDLLLNLTLSTEDMSLIMSKATHTHQTMQRTGELITVTGAKLRQTQRQITVGFQPLIL